MKLDRLVSILMTLLDQKRVGAQALAEMFEVSPRTIYRDMETLNLAGIPVRSIPGVGGGFEIMPDYKIDQTVFSVEDLSAILTGLSGFSDAVRGASFANTLAKIKSFIPADKAKEVALRTNQIRIDLSPWMGNEQLPSYLETIKTALDGHRLLSFSYTAHRGARTQRIIEPCQLVLKGSHWYVYGYCRSRNDYRLFRLSRMTGLHLEPDRFAPRAYPPPTLEFAEIAETMQINIQLRIHKSILDRVLAYCAYDRCMPDGDAHYIVNFPFIDNEYHYDLLLSFGEQCECLEPFHVRENLKHKIQRIAAVYDTART